MGLRDLFFSIFAEDRTGTAFDSLRRRAGQAGSDADTLARRFDQVGRGFTKMGAAAAPASLAMGLGLRGAIGAASEWEAALNRSNPLLRASVEEMGALEDLSLRLGKMPRFTAGEAAAGIEMLAKNGLSAAQVLGGALAGSLEVAIVGGAELSAAADVVTDAMVSFGVSAENVDRVVGGMAGTMSQSKMQFDDYRLALGQAGGVAGGLGVEMEDFNAVLAATASLFASGSDAGTSYKTFLTSLVPNSGRAADAMADLGLRFFDAEGSMLGMAEIAGELQAALGDLSDEAATTALRDIFGRDAMRTAIGLARTGREGIEAMQAAIGNTDASELAAARMMGAAGATEEWRSAIDGLGIAVARSGLLEAFTALVLAGTDFINWLGGLDPVFLRAGAAAAVFVTALAPVGMAVGGLALAIGTLGVPVTAAIAGFTLLTAGVAAFWPEIKAAYDWVSGKLSPALEWLGGIFSGLPQPIKDLAVIFGTLVNPLAILVTGTDAVGAAFSRTFGAIPGIVADTVQAVGVWIGERFNGILDSLGQKIEWVESKFAWLYDRVVGNSWVPDMVDEIGQSFAKLDGSMVKVADAATGSVNDAFKGLYGDVSGSIRSMVVEGELSWSGFWDGMANTGKRYADRIVGEVFDKLSGGIANAFSSSFSGGLGGFASAAFSSAGGILSGIGGWAGGLLGFDSGGSFSVTGRAGMDRNVAAVRLSAGEEVNVTRRGQSASPVVNVTIQAQDVESFRASRAQIGRQVSAAVSAGMRSA